MLQKVSIPQYRSGQFRRCSQRACGSQREFRKSQSLNTDQGSSDAFYCVTFLVFALRVSIPQYRSGQFRPIKPMISRMASPTAKSQSLNTDQGSSDSGSLIGSVHSLEAILSQSLNTDQGSSDGLRGRRSRQQELASSQSLNTDQGSSDPTPSKALKARELSGLFFQPIPRAPFWGSGAGIGGSS